MTWLLRSFILCFKRARRISQLLILAVKQRGGIRITLTKAISLYRYENLAGIKRAFQVIFQDSKNKNDYAEWMRRYDKFTEKMSVSLRFSVNTFPYQPLISIIMPTYNPKSEWLIQAIESVRAQLYENWELCIADDGSTNQAIRPILEKYAKQESRIKLVFRPKNDHISAASNSALALATGEWVALMDHDDLLTKHALLWVVQAIRNHPDVQLIYSDEDKIDEVGKRFDPYFKCDWNVDLFYSQNMIAHFGVYRTQLLRLIGGFRIGFEGSQDYDLALRCIEELNPQQIHHIPRILYHSRTYSNSTAQSNDTKAYAVVAGGRALNEHIQRKGIRGKVELVNFGYRMCYELPNPAPLVSLIIPTKNGLQLIRQCVTSILEKTVYSNYEIIILDNGSDDQDTLRYFDALRRDARIRVIREDSPFNYSSLNNAAVKIAAGSVVGLLNNDLEVISREWLSEMVSIALQPGVGAVGARLWYPNDTLQHGGVICGIGGVAAHAHKHFSKEHSGYFGRGALIQSLSAVTGACLIVKKSSYDEVGGMNEIDLKVAFNDVDFCLRLIEAGYRNVWTPYAELYHHESATRGYDDTPDKKERFRKEFVYMKSRWGEHLLNDPAYSPNLTIFQEDFSFAWPPRVSTLLNKSKNCHFVRRIFTGSRLSSNNNPHDAL